MPSAHEILANFQDQSGEHMQIHEVTAGQIKAGAKKIGTGAWNAAKNAGSAVGSAVGDELERLAFGGPVTDYSKAADLSKAPPKAPAQLPKPAAQLPRPTAPAQLPKPDATPSPAAGAAPNTGPAAGSAADPEVLDPLTKPAQKYTGINNNNVIDVDAREVPDPAKVAKLPQSAPAQLPKPVTQLPRPTAPAQLPKPVTQLPPPAAAPNFAQTNRVQYQPATVNAPVATVPTIPGKVTTAKPAAPNINPAAAPVVYRYQGRPLNPSNTADATRIAQLQALGKTSG
jgi:hypothetical protein